MPSLTDLMGDGILLISNGKGNKAATSWDNVDEFPKEKEVKTKTQK